MMARKITLCCVLICLCPLVAYPQCYTDHTCGYTVLGNGFAALFTTSNTFCRQWIGWDHVIFSLPPGMEVDIITQPQPSQLLAQIDLAALRAVAWYGWNQQGMTISSENFAYLVETIQGSRETAMGEWLCPLNGGCDQDGDNYYRYECGGNDCDDLNPYAYPGADLDRDGYSSSCGGGSDCDDRNPYAYPGSMAWMFCSGWDMNCNGAPDILDCTGRGSPILISTDGGKITLTSKEQGVLFDLFGTGERMQIPWTTSDSDDGWLVLDRDRNGTIDNGAELFGSFTPGSASDSAELPNGFAALSLYDTAEYGGNGDGQINKNDSIFANLQLWIDRNHNGISETSELRDLSDFGIHSIDLNYKDAQKLDPFGNLGRYRSKITNAKNSGVGRWAWDVFLNLQ